MPYSDTIEDLPPFERDAVDCAALIKRFPQYRNTIESMYRYGCAIIDPEFFLHDLDEARRVCASITPGIGRVQDAWKSNKAVANIATHPNVMRLLNSLYGRAAIPFQTLNVNLAAQQAVHSDTYQLNSRPYGYMCGIWVALENVSLESGAFFFYPESHRMPVIERLELPGEQTYADYERHMAARVRAGGFQKKHALLKKGQAFIWAANLAHGESPRLNPALTCYSQITRYFFEDCAYYSPSLYDEDRDEHVIREPYDIARRKFVQSNQDLMPGRASLADRVLMRCDIWSATLRHRLLSG